MRAIDVAYFTASCDTVKDNTKFAKELELDYPILSDPGQDVAKAYGVVHKGRAYPERWTFIIGTNGRILHIDKSVKAAKHANDVLAKLEDLGVAKKK